MLQAIKILPQVIFLRYRFLEDFLRYINEIFNAKLLNFESEKEKNHRKFPKDLRIEYLPKVDTFREWLSKGVKGLNGNTSSRISNDKS